MNEAAQKPEELTSKEALSQLESIVSSLESGELELEQSLERYSQGVKLLAVLQGKLDSAEQKVQVLMGQLAAAPEDDIQDTTLSKA